MAHPEAAFYYRLFGALNGLFFFLEWRFHAAKRKEIARLVDEIRVAQDLEWKVQLQS